MNVMNRIICNYAVVRYLPYRETGEFVNVGVVVSCPESGKFAFRCDIRRTRRVTEFFPEAPLEIYQKGLKGMVEELRRVEKRANEEASRSALGEEEILRNARWFRDWVHPRESLFFFSEPGTLLALDVQDALEILYARCVERQFAQAREYQETIMRRRLQTHLREWKINRYYKAERVGDSVFHVQIPFVYSLEGNPQKAIKPLDLAKAEPSDIYRHGDIWISAMNRLHKMGRLPSRMIFTVAQSDEGVRRQAAEEICSELKRLEPVVTIPYGDWGGIHEAAGI